MCSAAKALSGRASSKIPPSRVAELQAVILQHFGRENHTWPASLAEQQQLLAAALAVNPKTAAEGWQSHAAVVVAGVAAEGHPLQPCGEHRPHPQHQQHCTAPQPPLQGNQSLQQQSATATPAAPMQSASPAADTAANNRQDVATATAAAAATTGNSAAAVPASEAAAGAAPEEAAAAADAPLSWCTHAVATLAGAGALLATGAAEAAGLGAALESRVQQRQQGEQEEVQGQHQQEDDLTAQQQELTVHQQQQQCQLVVHGSTKLSCPPAMVYGFQSWLLAMTAAAALVPGSASSTSLLVAGSRPSIIEHSSSSSSSSAQQPMQSSGASTATGGHAGPAATTAATTASAGAAVATNSPQAAQQAGAGATEAAFGLAGAAGMQFSAAAEAALEAFVRGWRSHFLETMQPKFLPPFWSVDSRVKNSAAPTNTQG